MSRYKSGIFPTQIAAEEGVSKYAIFGIVRRYKEQQSAKSNPRSGRPTIIKNGDKNHIFRIIDKDPFITYNEILELTGLQCHRTTLTRSLCNSAAISKPNCSPKTPGFCIAIY